MKSEKKKNKINREKKINNRANRKTNRGKFSIALDFAHVDWDKAERLFSADKKYFLERLKKKKSIDPRTKEMLQLLAAGAVFGLSLFMPALPMALSPFIIDHRRFERKHFQQNVKSLKKQGLAEVVEEKGQTVVKITNEGKMRALRYKLTELRVKKPERWDGKWRVVVFDIPERHKQMRELFRRHLKLMGFYPLQKSVWVYAFPCFEEIEFLRQVYRVGVNVTCIVAEQIESAQDLKSYFQID